MIKNIGIIILSLGLFASSRQSVASAYGYTHSRRNTHCGIEREAYKTLADQDVQRIDLKPVASFVSFLDSLKPPYNPDRLRHRYAPVETHIYLLHANVIGYAYEADSDYHIVLSGKQSHQTMIAEMPSPMCVTNQKHKKLFALLRAQFRAIIGHRPSRWFTWISPIPISIAGVGFFDRLHHQNGVAPNGIELHPIIYIKAP